MLLTDLQKRSPPLRAPFATVTASFSHYNGLAALGTVGTVLLLQRLRRGLKANRERRQTQKQAKFAQVYVEAGPAEDSQWERNRSDLSKNIQSVQHIPLLEETVPLTVKQLWDLIYDHAFQQSFHDRVRDTQCQIGTWHHEGPELVRTKTFIHPVKKNALGPREAFTEENCQCLKRSNEGFLVEVQAFTREMLRPCEVDEGNCSATGEAGETVQHTANSFCPHSMILARQAVQVPYGRSFHVQLSWTASKASESSTKLVVAAGIVFTKKLLLGSFIRSAAHEGLMKSYEEYSEHLWKHIRAKGGPSTGQTRNAEIQPVARPSSNLRRLDSTQAARAMVEDLVKNGIFVSWWTVLSLLLFIWLCHLLIRLSASQNGRLLATSF